MSSSAEPPRAEPLGWEAFAPRAAGMDVELATPAAELGAVLQRYRADLDAAQGAVADAERAGLDALARQAVLAFRLETALSEYEPQLRDAPLSSIHRQLRILKDQMLAELADAGIEVVRLAGRPYAEVASYVDVEGWRHRAEYESELVAEELEPAVRHGEHLLRLGRVVMGAPLTAAPDGPDTGEHGRGDTNT